jgi:hypothetical protein
MPKSLRYFTLAILVVASTAFMAACSSSSSSKTKTATPTTEPTAAPTTEPTTAPTTEPTMAPTMEATMAPTTEAAMAPTTEATMAPTTEAATAPTTEATMAPTTEAAAVPDWSTMGFTAVLATEDFTPGTALTIKADPYTVEIPADAFSKPVTFEVLGASVVDFAANSPSGETPVLAFAFRVTDKATGNLIGKFDKPVTLTAKNADIVAKSLYYNLAPDGTYTANPTGLTVADGTLTHPIAGAAVAWVITAPASAS